MEDHEYAIPLFPFSFIHFIIQSTLHAFLPNFCPCVVPCPSYLLMEMFWRYFTMPQGSFGAPHQSLCSIIRKT